MIWSNPSESTPIIDLVLLRVFLRMVNNHQPLPTMSLKDVGDNRRAARNRRAVLELASSPDFFFADHPSGIPGHADVGIHGLERELREVTNSASSRAEAQSSQ